MRKSGLLCFVICLIIGIGCGKTELTPDAKNWLKQYQGIGYESLNAARKAKDKIDPNTQKELDTKLSAIMGTKNAVFKVLNEEQKKMFNDEFESITDSIQFQRSIINRKRSMN